MGIVTAFAVIMLATAGVYGRSLSQNSSPPPSGDGPVAQPAGTEILFTWHGVGTQNYTSAASTKYENTGAVADLFKPDKTLISKHLFLQPGRPSFTQINQNTGETIGFVTGTRLAAQDQEPQPDDGGFGSVPELLLQVVEASGSLSKVTYIQRLNTKGGVIPDGLFTLPAFGNIPNFQSAIPYQADYVFLVPEGTSNAG